VSEQYVNVSFYLFYTAVLKMTFEVETCSGNKDITYTRCVADILLLLLKAIILETNVYFRLKHN